MKTLFKTLNMFILSIVIMALLVTVILGFMLGLTHPLPWIIIVVLLVIPYFHDKLIKGRTLKWHHSMSTGIEMVDDDHKRLIKLINDFQKATEFNVSKASIDKSLNELVAYTKYHFSREERLLEINLYPDFSTHQQKHQQMIVTINQYIEDYQGDKQGDTGPLLIFLKSWLVKHIKGSDQEYVPFISLKNVSEHNMKSNDHV